MGIEKLIWLFFANAQEGSPTACVLESESKDNPLRVCFFKKAEALKLLHNSPS
jgi:hypothetical protein